MEDLRTLCDRVDATKRALAALARRARDREAAWDRKHRAREAAAAAKEAAAAAEVRKAHESALARLLPVAHDTVEALRGSPHWPTLLAHLGGVLATESVKNRDDDRQYRFSITTTQVWLDERSYSARMGGPFRKILHAPTLATLWKELPFVGRPDDVLAASIPWLTDLARGDYAQRATDRLIRDLETTAAWRRENL